MGDVVSGLIMGILEVIAWLIGVINLLSPHDPPSWLLLHRLLLGLHLDPKPQTLNR